MQTANHQALGKGIGKILDSDLPVNPHINTFGGTDYSTSVHLNAAKKRSDVAES